MEFWPLKKYSFHLLAAIFLTGALCLGPALSHAQTGENGSIFAAPTQSGEKVPVDLEADELTHDERTQTVTATGNVELVQGGRILKADSVIYNLQADTVRATGNVILSEEDGTTYFADDVELTSDMKNGFVEALHILLSDGARFSARTGTRSGTVLNLKQATYTPCEPCKENPQRPPVWQLRAKEIEHDEAEKRITYRNAWFEFMGVPLAYTPYFSHPDGTEKQKSGFLYPWAGYDSEQGLSYQQEYYYAIAPDKDATIGAMIYSNAEPVVTGEYRQRFNNAEMQIQGGATYSERTDSTGGQNVQVDSEARGHLFADGQWDMNEKWRSGLQVRVVSDDQYLRQYDIQSDDDDDVLENEVYAERFSGRNYAVGRVMAFQDVRVSSRQVDQPAVLPEVIASFYGDPNGLMGGRWNAELSALGLYRDGNGQDVARSSADIGWQRRYITGFGLVNKFDAQLRGDAYNIQDSYAGAGGDDTTVRGFALANWQTSYPLVNRFDRSQMVVEPLVAFTAATNADNNGNIPNEDSHDFSLDPTNLFEPNRSPGYDLVEDGTHMTYGVRTGLYGDNGYRGEVFLGQSRRLDDDNNPFPTGSGLSGQDSDYVGQVSAYLGENFNMDYRFQLESNNLSSHRHELDTYASWGRLQTWVRYFYASALSTTDLNETREQIQPGMRFRLADDWYANGSLWYDFGEDEGLRRMVYGLDYVGQCLSFGITTERNLTRDSTGDSGTKIMMRIGLKNLGEFEGFDIDVGSGSDNNDDEEE